VLRDVAVMLADGGDCLSDLAAYEGQERLFGERASETTTHGVLQSVDERLLERIRAARATARAGSGPPARARTRSRSTPTTLVAAHSEKERRRAAMSTATGFIRSAATKAPPCGAFARCAEEDSNLHPVIPDQALNLLTRLSYPSA
jgi:hypothetical protein